jgi:hypothetical protein
MICYVISVYEPADRPGRDGKFVEVASAPTLWALRAAIREVRRYYDSVSYAIDRYDEPTEVTS